ncbi:conserved protein of unknown function [Tenacibaculum sp. 190130A14a]|uniref:Uncharacterized protein n=1 Tax=Tenacibaculum polynesiense TaxID=3137857 RepID=A0ABM9PBF5_9FLAO
MSINNIDKEIVKRLKNREFTPSSSAWERLNTQLDEHKAKKKRKRFHLMSAASIVLLIGLTTFYFLKEDSVEIPEEIIVHTEANENMKSEELPSIKEMNGIEATVTNEEVIASVELTENVTGKVEKTIDKVNEEVKFDKLIVENVEIENTEMIAEEVKNVIPQTTKSQIEIREIKNKLVPANKASNLRIKVNSEDLLFAVTHTEEEVKEYYARHKVNREDVFKAIKLELRKSNLTVSPETILAEIERNIDDEEFKGNFMQKLKVKISDIAVAFTERNK